MEGRTLRDDDCVTKIDATIESIDLTAWLLRLTVRN
jgi:hypothetical protein